jgi:parvulin-like peptidyl-prolyl isomerase
MKPGEFSKPVRSARGWHILKVTDREVAYLTFQGARAAVKNALVRRRIEAILEKLRADAKIEDYLQGR